MRTFKNIAVLLFAISLFHNFLFSQWVSVTSGTSNFLRSVESISVTTNYAAGFAGTFLKSSNSGQTWETRTSPSSSNINNFHFPPTGTATTGWAASVSGLYKTTNGGVNWVQQIASQVFTDVLFTDLNTGIVLTSSQNVKRTTDGGTTFTTASFSSNNLIHGQVLAQTNAATYYVLAIDNTNDSSFVFKSTNQGTSWSQVFKTPGFYFDMAFVSSTNGIMCGDAGAMKRTTNGGVNWTAINTGVTADLVCVKFATTNTVYLVGATGTILKSTNQGLNWAAQVSGTTANLSSIDMFPTDDFGIVCGSGGTIRRTTNGGAVTGFIQTSGGIPVEYSLSQNYPNPFNPSTNIEFNLPSAGVAALKIYDMLGKEIAVLVNDNLASGTYSVSFDASSLPSGTYLYRITAGSFTQTKKLTLIK